MPQETRSLRSNKKAQSGDDEKFDFDVDESEIDPHETLKTINRGYPKDSNDTEDVEEKRKLIDSMSLEVQRNDVAKKLDNNHDGKDMLSDELYLAYHKKMMRHEARMLESDLVQGENEADKFALLSEKLDLSQWQPTLKKVTAIKDSDDEEEMQRKRVLTKESIDSMLERYRTMKKNRSIVLRNHRTGKIDPVKHWSQIYNKINRRIVLDYHSSSDEEEDNMDINKIRTHRRRLRERQCRGSIIIELTMAPCSRQTKYAIVAEPLRKPYVIRLSKQERHLWNKQLQQAPREFTNYTEFPNQMALPKRKVPIPLTINGASKEPSQINGNLTHITSAHERINFTKEHINCANEDTETSMLGNKKRTSDSLQVEAHTLPVKRVKRRQ